MLLLSGYVVEIRANPGIAADIRMMPRVAFAADDHIDFARAEFDDRAWRRISVPGAWQSQGIQNHVYRGWMRFRFTLDRSYDQPLAWQIGRLCYSADEAYLNGRPIGGHGNMGVRPFVVPPMGRVYKLPLEILRPVGEENVLALRIFRHSDAAGILSGPIRIGPYSTLLTDQWRREAGIRHLEALALSSSLLLIVIACGCLLQRVRSRTFLWLLLLTAGYLASIFSGSLIAFDLGWIAWFSSVIAIVLASPFLWFLALFAASILRFTLPRWLHVVFVAHVTCVLGLLMLLPWFGIRYPMWIQLLSTGFELSGMLGLGYLVWQILRSIRKGTSPHGWSMFIAILIAVVASVLAYLDVVRVLGLDARLSAVGLSICTMLFNFCVGLSALREFVLLRNRSKLLRSKVLQATEAEQQRVARDLHDGVAQSLQGLRMKTQVLAREHGKDVPEMVQLADDLGHTVEELRRTARELTPGYLESGSLLDAMHTYADHFSEQINVLFHADVLADVQLPLHSKEHLFRVFQEALSNAARHSGASLFQGKADIVRGALLIQFSDNGQGFDPERADKGLGLSTMRERVELLEGDLSIDSAEGRGLRIKIKIPISKAGLRQGRSLVSDGEYDQGRRNP